MAGEFAPGAQVLHEVGDVVLDVGDDVGDGEELLEGEVGFGEVLGEHPGALVTQAELRGVVLVPVVHS